MGPRAGLDDVEKKEISSPRRELNPSSWTLAHRYADELFLLLAHFLVLSTQYLSIWSDPTTAVDYSPRNNQILIFQ
jgi:hypothetical protein